jgi:citronellol/citronellal dehydrogenase
MRVLRPQFHRDLAAIRASLQPGAALDPAAAQADLQLAIAVRAARDGANVVIAAKSGVPNPKLPGTIHTAAEAVRAAGGDVVRIDPRSLAAASAREGMPPGGAR